MTAPDQSTIRPPDDLSMNETPYAPLPSVRKVVTDAAGFLNRYPDHASSGLTAALSRRWDVDPSQVLIGPGSAGLCQHIIGGLGPARREVVHSALSFEAYPLLIANGGARPIAVPANGYRHDLDAMAAAITDETRCVLVCNPNNPTGAVARRDEIEAFLAKVPSDVVVILDEAYHEFVTDPLVPDGLDLSRTHENLIVLRTFSKAYGLAALRVGYAVGAAAVIGRARMMNAVFFPSGPGQSAAIASLEPAAEAELRGRCADLAVERARLSEALVAEGLVVAPSEANFLWLVVGADAEAFATRCRDAGILVRAYPGHGVRVTIGSREANDRFRAVVRQMALAAS